MIMPSGTEHSRARLIEDNEIPPLPEGWDVQRFRFLFRESKERNGDTPVGDMLSVSEYRGVVPKEYEHEEQKRTDEELHTYRVVRPGQLAVNTMWLNHLGLGVSDHLGHVSPAYAVYDISPELDHRFAHHLLRSQYYLKIYLRYLYGIRPNSFQIKADDWNSIPVIMPPRSTQKAISDFLDRETVRIDQLIEKKQRLVRLLGERREALVEEHLDAVDPQYINRLKFAIRRIEQGWSPQCEDGNVDGGRWGVLKLGAITTGVYLEEHHKVLPEAIEPIPSLRVQEGDVLVARASGSPKLVGRSAFVESADLNLMLSDKHFRLVPNKRKVVPEYLSIVVNSRKSRTQIENSLSSAEGMARNISQNVIYGLRCPFPSVEVQKNILSGLRASRATSDALVVKTTASIDRLKEYRSALITAAVTGQIDVTTWGKRGQTDRRLDEIEEAMQG